MDFEKAPILTEAPIIGVLAQELPKHYKVQYPEYDSYIAASYVKAVECAGGRVVPVFVKQDLEYYK